jgi:hypothetical protein
VREDYDEPETSCSHREYQITSDKCHSVSGSHEKCGSALPLDTNRKRVVSWEVNGDTQLVSYPGTLQIASLAEPHKPSQQCQQPRNLSYAHIRCRPVEWNISSPKCQFQSWINISKLRSQLKYRDYIDSQVTHVIDTKVQVTKKESVRAVESMMLLTF